MKKELIQSLTTTFEAHAQQTEGGVEYWLVRDLQHLLGYAEWRNFNNTAISKAKTACEMSGHAVSDHFVDVNKMVDLGSASHGRSSNLTCRNMNGRVESGPRTPYTSSYIRPMAVRPLDHPERWPTPWGFLFSDTESAMGQLQ